LITGCGVPHEFRTTLVASLLTGKDLLRMTSLISSAQKYVLQKFVPSKHLDPNFQHERILRDEEINDIKAQLEKRLSCIIIR